MMRYFVVYGENTDLIKPSVLPFAAMYDAREKSNWIL